MTSRLAPLTTLGRPAMQKLHQQTSEWAQRLGLQNGLNILKENRKEKKAENQEGAATVYDTWKKAKIDTGENLYFYIFAKYSLYDDLSKSHYSPTLSRKPSKEVIFENIKRHAASRSVDAIFQRGLCYETGFGVTANIMLALQDYFQSAFTLGFLGMRPEIILSVLKKIQNSVRIKKSLKYIQQHSALPKLRTLAMGP